MANFVLFLGLSLGGDNGFFSLLVRFKLLKCVYVYDDTHAVMEPNAFCVHDEHFYAFHKLKLVV